MFNISRITYYRHDNIMIQNTLSSKKTEQIDAVDEGWFVCLSQAAF